MFNTNLSRQILTHGTGGVRTPAISPLTCVKKSKTRRESDSKMLHNAMPPAPEATTKRANIASTRRNETRRITGKTSRLPSLLHMLWVKHESGALYGRLLPAGSSHSWLRLELLAMRPAQLSCTRTLWARLNCVTSSRWTASVLVGILMVTSGSGLGCMPLLRSLSTTADAASAWTRRWLRTSASSSKWSHRIPATREQVPYVIHQ